MNLHWNLLIMLPPVGKMYLIQAYMDINHNSVCHPLTLLVPWGKCFKTMQSKIKI